MKSDGVEVRIHLLSLTITTSIMRNAPVVSEGIAEEKGGSSGSGAPGEWFG